MRNILAAILFIGFLASQAAGQQPEPCRLLTMQAILNDLTSTGYSGEGDVQCKDEYTNPYQGMFSARAWIVDETTSTTVSEATLPACSGLACTGNVSWVGGLGGTFSVRTHCFRAHVSGASTFYSNEVASAQKCDPGPPPPAPVPPPGSGGSGGDDTFNSSGAGSDPIVIPLHGQYTLSGLNDPVAFDINAIGHPQTVGWTARAADAAFLALDRNGNGRIDDGTELFGNVTPLPGGGRAANGFDGLAQYDANGDGVIDDADPIWNDLLLWVDENHNGISEPGELRHITDSTITAIELDHHWTGRRDQYGNHFGFEGRLHEGKQVRTFYDVFFVTAR